MSLSISRRTSDRLDQRGLRSQETFLVRIQNRHQCYFRNVQSLSQKVNSHQHVEHVQSHIADDLGPFQRIDIRVQILDTDARILHIICEILRHTLSQRRHQHLIMLRNLLVNLRYQIINLPLNRTNHNLRIKQSGRSDNLFCPEQFMFFFIMGGSRRDEHHLIDMLLKFLKAQRPVIQRRRQPESIIHKHILSGSVTRKHCPDLWYRHMGLIDNDEEIVFKIV